MQPLKTQLGDYVVLEIAPPGRTSENAGILLVDRESGEARVKFRRDLEELVDPEDLEMVVDLEQDLLLKADELGGNQLLTWVEENASNFIRSTERRQAMVDTPDRTLKRLYSRYITPKVIPFRTHLPLFGVEAAAGSWGRNLEVSEDAESWVEAPEDVKLSPDMFVARVTGHSMEPRIPADSLCIFQGGSTLAGSRNNKLVLVLNYGEPGENRFTIKRYKSHKQQTEEGWSHERITLEPLNPAYEAWDLDEHANIKVVGIFVRVLEADE